MGDVRNLHDERLGRLVAQVEHITETVREIKRLLGLDPPVRLGGPFLTESLTDAP